MLNICIGFLGIFNIGMERCRNKCREGSNFPSSLLSTEIKVVSLSYLLNKTNITAYVVKLNSNPIVGFFLVSVLLILLLIGLAVTERRLLEFHSYTQII